MHSWPRDIKAFYMRGNDDGKTVAAMDVLFPRAGEMAGGSQVRLESQKKRKISETETQGQEKTGKESRDGKRRRQRRVEERKRREQGRGGRCRALRCVYIVFLTEVSYCGSLHQAVRLVLLGCIKVYLGVSIYPRH